VLVGSVFFTGEAAHADRGVGVNLGRIDINDRLRPGGVYSLPILGVSNTGTEAAAYEVVISAVQGQGQMLPPQAWFNLEPQRFRLEPGSAQSVRMKLNLPAKARAGDYFGLIEAHLTNEDGASIGAAAATELAFTVKPSNWLAAQQIRLNRQIDELQPWSYLVPLTVLITFIGLALRRNFRIGIRFERR
jgi:hypothetical protein